MTELSYEQLRTFTLQALARMPSNQVGHLHGEVAKVMSEDRKSVV